MFLQSGTRPSVEGCVISVLSFGIFSTQNLDMHGWQSRRPRAVRLDLPTIKGTRLVNRATHSRFQDYLDAAVLLMFEGLVHHGRVIERDFVRDDKGRIDLSVLDLPETDRHVFLHVRLTGFER